MNEQYHFLLEPYQNACQILLTRLNVLNHTLYTQDSTKKDPAAKGDPLPIHTMQHRLKSKKSIEEKLQRSRMTASVSNARDHLLDVAGIRIICYFVGDIYNLADALRRQNDLVWVKEKDYIASPKPNGYRSLHIVAGVPVYYGQSIEYFPVEIQLRTMAMDFWASMEHRICYKKTPRDSEALRREFSEYAGLLERIEEEFENYNKV